MSCTALALGVFFGFVLVVLVLLMVHDWDDSEPGRQGYRDRKR